MGSAWDQAESRVQVSVSGERAEWWIGREVVYDGGYDGVVYVGLFEKGEEKCSSIRGCLALDAGFVLGLAHVFGVNVSVLTWFLLGYTI